MVRIVGKATVVIGCILFFVVAQYLSAQKDSDKAQPKKNENNGLLDAAATLKKIAVELEKREKEYGNTRVMADGMLNGELLVNIANRNVTFRFIYIPPGSSIIGYSKEELFRIRKKTQNVMQGFNAKPQVSVNIGKGFFILLREITVDQFRLFEPKANAKRIPRRSNDGGNVPVTNVSWREANTFCEKLTKVAGWKIRLPTEIEWEYAARGPWPQRFPWFGSEQHAWAGKGKTGKPRAAAEGIRDQSWRGVLDLSGNVSEWCADKYEHFFHENLKKSVQAYKPASIKIEKGEDTTLRTYRGGNFSDEILNCEIPLRRAAVEHTGSPTIGFRIVLIPEFTATEKMK